MSNYRYFNPNPSELDVGDCVIRALCKALNKSWEDVYVEHGMSYDSNRNRDSMGRYSRNAFMDKLMEMRMSAPNDKAKRAVDKMIDELEN